MELFAVLEGTEALRHLEAAHDAAWDVVDSRLLEVCRNRMAMLLGHGPTLAELGPDDLAVLSSWPDAGLAAVEVAALAFTEEYTIDVAAVSDEQTASLRSHLGDEGLANFVNALLVVEQRMRLELVWDGVLRLPAGAHRASPPVFAPMVRSSGRWRTSPPLRSATTSSIR